jgi:hypothetical protein
MKQSLWDRLIASTAVAVLLRHRATNVRSHCPRRILLIDPQFGQAAAAKQTLRTRLVSLEGRGFIANVDVVIAHDRFPSVEGYLNALLLRKVACRSSLESAAPVFRFTADGLATALSAGKG